MERVDCAEKITIEIRKRCEDCEGQKKLELITYFINIFILGRLFWPKIQNWHIGKLIALPPPSKIRETGNYQTWKRLTKRAQKRRRKKTQRREKYGDGAGELVRTASLAPDPSKTSTFPSPFASQLLFQSLASPVAAPIPSHFLVTNLSPFTLFFSLVHTCYYLVALTFVHRLTIE